jgi:hypothetical protein
MHLMENFGLLTAKRVYFFIQKSLKLVPLYGVPGILIASSFYSKLVGYFVVSTNGKKVKP